VRFLRIYAPIALFWPITGITVASLHVFFISVVTVFGFQRSQLVWRTVSWIVWVPLAAAVVAVALRLEWRPGRRARFIAGHCAAALAITALHGVVYALLLDWLALAGSRALGDFAYLPAIYCQELPLNALVYCVTAFGARAFLHLRTGHARALEKLALERSIARGELEMFKLRLQPAFVAGKLTAFAELVERDADRAESLIVRFGQVLRRSIGRGDARRTIADEAAYLHALVEMERVLDPRTPRFEMVLPAQTASLSLPAGAIAPLIQTLLQRYERGSQNDPAIVFRAEAFEEAVVVQVKCSWTVEDDLERIVHGVRRQLGDGERLECVAGNSGTIVRYSGPARQEDVDDAASFALVAFDEQEPAPARRFSFTALAFAAYGAAFGLYVLLFAFLAGITWVANERYNVMRAVEQLGVIALCWPMTAAIVFSSSWIARMKWVFAMTLVVVLAALTPILWSLMSESQPLLSGQLTVDYLVFLSVGVGVIAYRKRDDVNERSLEIAELAARFARMNVSQLRLQLNPHFLFNSLNSLAALLSDPAAARTMALRLRDFVSFILAGSDRELVPLREELAIVSAYVDIENLRFDTPLALEIAVDDALLDTPVPSFILQPLVENAIRHGFADDLGGTITIAASMNERELRLTVRDDGRGASPAWPMAEGIGLTNTRLRLRQLYGEGCRVDARRGTDGFATRVTIPLRHVR
jgi:two-component system, LytTR family, sensor kinase